MCKILTMNLDISVSDNESSNEKEYKITISSDNINKSTFIFNLSDETTDNLRQFIDFLLDSINLYDKLEIIYHDDGSETLKNIIGNNFKKIWEDEFKSVKDEINNLT